MKPLALLLLLGSASASELRIYPSFSEVREPVRVTGPTFTLDLPESVWAQLVPGTLDLEGVRVTASQQRTRASWLATQEGQPVTLIEEGRAPARVTLVRALDLLIRDADGRYRNVRFEQLAFDRLPPENAGARTQQLAFNVAAPGNATLSYLTRGVTWSPRYTLRLSGTAATLTGLAELRNTTDQPYEVTKGELVAGDVNLQAGSPQFFGDARLERAVPAAAPTSNVVAQGERRGLYRYALTDAFTLAPNSTLSLPFLNPKTTFERFAGLTTGFSSGFTQGKLSRGYRVRADVLLPGGIVTVRDEGSIVGQVGISDTSANDPVELDLGSDPDVGYTRAVQVVRQDKTVTVYRVTLTLDNAKERALRVEYRELLGGNVTVEGGATRTPQGLEVRVDVPAKSKVTRTYTVTFRQPG
jgi:hypothetical protein